MNVPLPVIDLAQPESAIARAIDGAAREHGFFYIVNHAVDAGLIDRLARLSREFFAQDEAAKLQIPMSAGGRAWRGYFPAGGELTSNRPDWKEGLYLGQELAPDHPRVRAGVPLHGANLFPALPGFRATVLDYIDALTAVGHRLLRALSLGLGLPADHFAEHGTRDPLILLRLFNYPSRPVPRGMDVQWGVGEHTDYGLLTMLWQDGVGGLEVKSRGRWIAAPPLPGSFVCNIGDMLDRMTGGRYRSNPHRVAINTSGRDRLSIPLFFDPDFDATVQPVPGLVREPDDRAERWDGASVHDWQGRYGDYVLGKVGKVFPELRAAVL
jgi:polar amino acid transport system ATP-binding protein